MANGRHSHDGYRFFLKHAGWSHGPDETSQQGRRRCARAMAQAEAHAEVMGWRAEWVADDEPYESDDDSTPREVLGCVLKNERGEVLASLWGIADPDRTYARVVEAELADEARAAK